MRNLFDDEHGADSDQRDYSQPPHPDAIVKSGLAIWVNRRGKPLPPPCPNDFGECAQWWMEQIQEPETMGETRLSASFGGRPGWHEGYALRLRNTLLRFLDLSPADRQYILAARQDGVFWRGEPIGHFVKIFNETIVMRDHPKGVDGYRSECLKRMKNLDFTLPGVKQRAE